MTVRTIASLLAALLTGLVLTLPALAAQEVPDGRMPAVDETAALYRSVTVVTGTRIETRLPGFAETLVDVLVKVTGDQTIRNERRLAAAAKSAQDLVLRFSYRDRLAGKPVHDEQGTHDRPHFLTVDFDPAKVNALAVKLGRKPWPLPRPRVLLLVAVENIKNAFVLTRDGTIDRSDDMRLAVAAAAAKTGQPPVVLPTDADLLDAARGLNRRGVAVVVVSLGADGALFVDETRALHGRLPPVQALSTVGAGDAMVAGLIAAFQQDGGLEDVARLSVAFAAAKLGCFGPNLPDPATVRALAAQVTLTGLD